MSLLKSPFDLRVPPHSTIVVVCAAVTGILNRAIGEVLLKEHHFIGSDTSNLSFAACVDTDDCREATVAIKNGAKIGWMNSRLFEQSQIDGDAFGVIVRLLEENKGRRGLLVVHDGAFFSETLESLASCSMLEPEIPNPLPTLERGGWMTLNFVSGSLHAVECHPPLT